MRILLVPTLAALALLGCQPDKTDLSAARHGEAQERAEAAQKVAAEGTAAVAAMATATLTEAEAAQVLARVGDQKITAGDLARMLVRLPKHMRARYAGLEARKELLERLVEMEVLAREAKVRGFERDPVVQHVLKQTLANELMRQQGAEETTTLSDIPMEEVKTYFEANQEAFGRAERRRAAVLYVDTKSQIEEHLKAIKTATEQSPLLARQIFGDFAGDKSIDRTSRALKGDVGWFDVQGRGDAGEVRAGEVIVKAVFALETVHQITPPFQVDNDSWAIAQMTNRAAAKTRSLKEVTLEIKDTLLRQRRVAKRQEFLDQLMERTTVEIDDDALKRLQLPTGDTEAEASKDKAKGPPRLPKIKLSPKALRHARPDLRARAPAEEIPLKMDPKIRLNVKEVQEKMKKTPNQSTEVP